jgi:hypothetical protein
MKTCREILLAGAALSATFALPRSGLAVPALADGWRRFDVVTTLEVTLPEGRSQAWIPITGFSADEWVRAEGNTWQTNAASAEVVEDPTYGARMLHVIWNEGTTSPVVSVTSRFATRDWRADLSKSGDPAPLSDEERGLYLASTSLMPTDGADNELAKARAIYEWMVENTFRRASTRGCSEGDVAAML